MKEYKCAECKLRSRYDRNPRSLLSRFWKWHITWCPGWRSYIKSLPAEERDKLVKKYS